MTSERAVSLGLVVTELVINALKHAFPGGVGGSIAVKFEFEPASWHLTVSDNGVGMDQTAPEAGARHGLGTSIVDSLTQQLGGQVTKSTSAPGTIVSITVPNAPAGVSASGPAGQRFDF